MKNEYELIRNIQIKWFNWYLQKIKIFTKDVKDFNFDYLYKKLHKIAGLLCINEIKKTINKK